MHKIKNCNQFSYADEIRDHFFEVEIKKKTIVCPAAPLCASKLKENNLHTVWYYGYFFTYADYAKQFFGHRRNKCKKNEAFCAYTYLP